jgi:hypothetical protein
MGEKNMSNEYTSDQKKMLSAVCGLFCPACVIYVAQRESPENREQVAKSFNLPPEMLKCDGCRAESRFIYCEQNCKMKPCVEEKGIGFCGECDEYPCETIKTFQAEMPHRLELWAALDRIKEVGHEKWFDEMLEHYSCPECNTINTAYLPACRKCGNTPSCEYVEQHDEEIKTHSFFKNR